MTNEEKFKTNEERTEGFRNFCSQYKCLKRWGWGNSNKQSCSIQHEGPCAFSWLKLEYEEPEPELKPCPFCGGKAKLLTDITGAHFSSVRCETCFIQTPLKGGKQDAADFWNNRRAK